MEVAFVDFVLDTPGKGKLVVDRIPERTVVTPQLFRAYEKDTNKPYLLVQSDVVRFPADYSIFDATTLLPVNDNPPLYAQLEIQPVTVILPRRIEKTVGKLSFDVIPGQHQIEYNDLPPNTSVQFEFPVYGTLSTGEDVVVLVTPSLNDDGEWQVQPTCYLVKGLVKLDGRRTVHLPAVTLNKYIEVEPHEFVRYKDEIADDEHYQRYVMRIMAGKMQEMRYVPMETILAQRKERLENENK